MKYFSRIWNTDSVHMYVLMKNLKLYISQFFESSDSEQSKQNTEEKREKN